MCPVGHSLFSFLLRCTLLAANQFADRRVQKVIKDYHTYTMSERFEGAYKIANAFSSGLREPRTAVRKGIATIEELREDFVQQGNITRVIDAVNLIQLLYLVNHLLPPDHPEYN